MPRRTEPHKTDRSQPPAAGALRRRLRCSATLLLLFALHLLLAPPPAFSAADNGVVRIGVLAKRGAERCLAQWRATADYLSAQVPDSTTFVIVPLDFDEIDPAVERGEVDFLLVNSAIYVEMEERYGVGRIATMINQGSDGGYTVFGGVIFTRADRQDIETFDDLRGKTFAAVDRTSLGGWLAAWRELKTVGIDPEDDFAGLEFAGTHDAVVYAVRDGKADAGTVRTDTLERMAAEGKIELDTFHVLDSEVRRLHGATHWTFPFLHSTRFYPEWPMAKLRHTDPGLARQVAVALLLMPPDSLAARNARVVGWTIPLDYQPVHECLKELGLGPYGELKRPSALTVLRLYWRWLLLGLAMLATAFFTTVYLRQLNARLQRSEASTRAAHAELDQIFQTAADGIRVVASDFTVLRVNRTLEEMMGVTAAEEMGTPCFKGFPGDYCHTPRCPLTRIMGGEPEVIYEALRQSRTGRRVHCLVAAKPFRDSDGTLIGMVEHFRDITELKQAEMALREALAQSRQLAEQLEARNEEVAHANKELEATNIELKETQAQILHQEKMASIGQLAAGIAHEINNPMGFIASNLGTLDKYTGRFVEFIKAQAEILEKEGCEPSLAALRQKREELKIDFLSDDVTDLIHESLDGADRVKSIVQNLKGFARIDQDERSMANINDCLETTLNIVWNELKYKAEVIKEYGELPEVECYPQQLNQVFMNLLVNAGQAIDKNGKIRIRTWRQDDSVWVAIADTGQGIDPKARNRIFEPFFTTKEVGKGTGLGLSITYDIVRKHGGDILVASEPGRGAVFTLRLPLSLPGGQDE